MLLRVRSLLFHVAFYATLIALMILGLPVLALGRGAVLRLAQLWARVSLALLAGIAGTRIEWRGLDHVPPGASIVAAKHQSFLEIIAFISRFPDFTFVLKRELTRIPLFGWYIAGCGQIAIDRASGRAALKQVSVAARAVLAEDRHLFIFPEGTRRRPGAPPDYKAGVALVYGETGVPCVPVALDTGLYWGRRSLLRRPGTAVIEFLPAIAPGRPRQAFMADLETSIEAASTRLLATALAVDPRLAAAAERHPASPAAAAVSN